MLIEPDYRQHRIEVNAVRDGDRWHADVMIRRTLSPDNPRARELLQAQHVACGAGWDAVGGALH